jgi:hypothetical protein
MMGKNLTDIEDNTRMVLFEKHQLYHYKFESGGQCLEVCEARKGENKGKRDIHIGSNSCESCVFNAGYSQKRHYVICRNLIKAISFNK